MKVGENEVARCLRVGLLRGLMALAACGCGHAAPHLQREAAPIEERDGVRFKGSSVHARIAALVAQGEFVQARALIAEATSAGLLTHAAATRLTERVTMLTTKLGEVPARLQRVANFPSQLKDFTLFEIKQMLERKDYSLATHAQLKLAEKLIEQPGRLMEKL